MESAATNTNAKVKNKAKIDFMIILLSFSGNQYLNLNKKAPRGKNPVGGLITATSKNPFSLVSPRVTIELLEAE
jgi:hypothetical protein